MKKEIQLLISEEFAEKIIPENDSVRLTADAGYESEENSIHISRTKVRLAT